MLHIAVAYIIRYELLRVYIAHKSWTVRIRIKNQFYSLLFWDLVKVCAHHFRYRLIHSILITEICYAKCEYSHGGKYKYAVSYVTRSCCRHYEFNKITFVINAVFRELLGLNSCTICCWLLSALLKYVFEYFNELIIFCLQSINWLELWTVVL